MIEFNGDLGEKGKLYIIRLYRYGHLIAGLIICSIFSLLLSPVYYLISKNLIEFIFYFFLLYIIISVLVVIESLIPLGRKGIAKSHSPLYIRIYEDKFYYKSPTEEKLFNFSDLKVIIDCGEYYIVKFYFSPGRRCLCQKDLIAQGTIEQFEEIFKDKLVRKLKKTKQKASQTNNKSIHKSDIDNKEVIQSNNPVSQDKIKD